LMMSADGTITDDEREVLKGALRSLSDDTVTTLHIDAMLAAAAQTVADLGREAHLRQIAEDLRDDPARSEVAFILAAAVAFADNAIADEENDMLDTLAEGLGIDEARVEELLDSVEGDLGNRQV